jgi:beta-N-acetylhexosaminidase
MIIRSTLFYFAIILTVLIVLVCIFYFSPYLFLKHKIELENTFNIEINNGTIDFSSLTLKQKIAQMIIVRGDFEDTQFTNLNIGGIFLDKQKTNEEYSKLIMAYQKTSKIKLFVSTDLEGAWNPFNNFKDFPKFSEINSSNEAYNAGFEEGKLMKEIGFNLNFAPVAEFNDEVYGGRSFNGSKEEIKEKLISYILGIQKNVFGVCKHYPGKGLIKNTHWTRDYEEISLEDLELFQTCFENNISGVMVGHQITYGAVSSEGRPSSVSNEVIKTIPKNILIISDSINMMGLKSYYFLNKGKMYADLINSGENIILDLNSNSGEIYKTINLVEDMVKKKLISENKINEDVLNILKLKGYEVHL